MAIIFLSDIHLEHHAQEHPLKKKIEQLIEAHRPQALIFLGDIFEFWWGDDHQFAAYKSWEEFFSSLNLDIFFIAGNRDFLCGPSFFKRSKITALPSGTELIYCHQRFALYHGDEQALEDKSYQLLRSIFRTSWVQKIWLLFPEAWRQKFSLRARKYSRAPLNLQYNYSHWSKKHQKANYLIHGHCHKQQTLKHEHLKIFTLGDCYFNERFSALLLKEDQNNNLEIKFLDKHL